jgi:hypothetical protein
MKPYCNRNGKALWSLFWGDKPPRKHKKRFKKSARQLHKKEDAKALNTGGCC